MTSEILSEAVRRGDLSTISSIIDSDVEVDIFKLYEEAAQYNKLDVIMHLLTYDDLLADVYDDSLLAAAKANSIDVLKYLVSQEDYDPYEGLKKIVRYSNDDSFLELLKYLDSIGIEYYDEELPGDIARHGKFRSFVQLLPRIKDPNMYLGEAVIGGDLNIVKLLINRGADISLLQARNILPFSRAFITVWYIISTGKIPNSELEKALPLVHRIGSKNVLDFITNIVNYSEEPKTGELHKISILSDLIERYY